MYTDDTVIYIHEINFEEAALKLTLIMKNVKKWLVSSCFHLNVKKVFFFHKTHK